jgi:ABC-type multidrug transport system ATPase subunit
LSLLGTISNSLIDRSTGNMDANQAPDSAPADDGNGSPSKRSALQIKIVWKDVNYYMLEKDPLKSKFMKPEYKTKHILQNVSGSASSGQLLAIMGPTGCGKTSLLNVLAARVPNGNQKMSALDGTITVNSEPRNDVLFRRISAYVMQDDNMYPHLTVLETFTLAAAFYLPYESDHDAIVDAVIHELGLVKCKDTIIGDDKLRGVSGGERKRANIGVQLISDPAVLFLDEPTSGLDSFQALSVMEAMKEMTKNGRLVITVIHQPRSSIFYMFDKLLLLSEGKTMYYGPSEGALEYFGKNGYMCPDLFNPADFYLDILSPDVRTHELEEASFRRIDQLAEAWNKEPAASVQTGRERDGSNAGLASATEIRGVGTEGFDFRKEMYVTYLLFWRTWAEQSRDVATLTIKFVLTIFFALVIGGLFSNIGNSQRSIQNRNGLFFFIMINQCFNTLVSVVNVFPKEKTIVNRERSSNAYTTFAYFTSKILVETPLIVLPSLLYSLIIYWMVGLNENHFIEFALILMLLNLTAAALGLAVSAMSPSVEAANAASTPFMIIAILFGGFYINIKSKFSKYCVSMPCLSLMFV